MNAFSLILVLHIMTLEKNKEEIYTCNRTRCGFCRDQCPVYAQLKFEAYSSRGKMQIARGLLEGVITPDPALMECLSLCTLCGYCQANCALNTVEIFKDLRETVIKQGIENKFHKRALNNILEGKSPFGPQETKKSDWAKNLSFDKTSKILFFAGCSYPIMFPRVLQNVYEVLSKANVKLNYFGEAEDCCGLLMDLTGYRDEFNQHKSVVKDRILELGIETIITPCPGCYKILKKTYFNVPENSSRVKVLHFVEFYVELIKNQKVTFQNSIGLKVTWHDPCDLGRHMGLFEEPRTILRAIPGIELIEMEHNQYKALCCGSGGGMISSNADVSIDIAIRRLKEAEEIGAEALVTMCPTCESIFEKAIRYTDSTIKLFDLAEILLKTI